MSPSIKPILFLFRPGFADPKVGSDNYYCPFCMRIEGMLRSFPQLTEELDIQYVDFDGPRRGLDRYAAVGSQSCPQLVLRDGDDSSSAKYTVEGLENSRRIIKTSQISSYFSERFGLPTRHP